MSEFLDCPKDETIELCPICNSPKKPTDEWPESGTHIFTIPYECGTEIDYPIGYEGASYGATCDGKVKKYTMPKITKEEKEKLLKEWRRISKS